MTGSNQALKRRAGVEVRRSPEGAVLVDMNTGRAFRLNRVGAEIWSLLESPIQTDELCEQIAGRYGRPLEQIEGDVRALLDELARETLIERSSETRRGP